MEQSIYHKKDKVKYESYEFVKDPFDYKAFEDNVLAMIAAFFCSGVRVNGVVYTLEEGIFPVIDGAEHFPMEYEEGACVLFLLEILSDVPADQFSDEEQMDVVAQISNILSSPLGFGKITIRTGSQEKYRLYGDAVANLTGKELGLQPWYGEELQASSSAVATDKVRSAKVDKGEVVFAQDMAFGFLALGGAPGPFVKHFLESNSPKEIDVIVHKLGDKRCCAEISLSAVFMTIGLNTVTSTIRCDGEWKYGSVRKDIEDSFIYGIDANKGISGRVISKRNGKELTLVRVSMYWLLARIKIGKPNVKIRIKDVVVKKKVK